MSLKSFTTLVAISVTLILNVACQTFEIRDYRFWYQYHPALGSSAVNFGVLSHDFVEISEEEFDKMKHLMIMMPPETWRMLSSDLLKACSMLGNKCKNSVAVIDSIFIQLMRIDEEIEKRTEGK